MSAAGRRQNCLVDTHEVRGRISAFIHQHRLIPSGGEVTCLVSGGADSTCLWHALRELGYRVSALHVNHGLRGAPGVEPTDDVCDVRVSEVDQRSRGEDGGVAVIAHDDQAT